MQAQPATDAPAWQAIAEVIRANDAHCRGVLLLGLEASEDVLAQGFRAAAGCAGSGGGAPRRAQRLRWLRRSGMAQPPVRLGRSARARS